MLRLLILLLVLPVSAFSQGCSDAGFCTMGAMKPDQSYNKRIALRLLSMEISSYRGTTTLTPIIYVTTADLNFSINRKNTFQVKIPFQHVEGRLAKTSGMSDISLCFTRNVYSSDKFDLNFSLGGKIPTNSSNKKSSEGQPLPMYYQTSLGTFDLIAGLSVINRKWLFATGIQIPFNRNHNNFDWHRWPQDDPQEFAYVQRYPNASQLQRGIDVMLRVERNFRFSKFNFSAGLLPIYRVTSDEITNAKGFRVGEDLSHNKGKGLALSAIGTTGYNFSARSGIKLLLGHKLVNRKFSPDGLTREFVSSITYIHRF